MLFRGWTGGKSRERRGEVFVPVLKAEVCISGWEEEDNSPLWLLSIVPLRHLLRHDRGTLSQHIQYSVVHVTCTPVCMVFCRSGSGTMKTLCTCLIFFYTDTQWWTGDGSFTACLLSVDEAVSRCFSKSLSRRLKVSTLESV